VSRSINYLKMRPVSLAVIDCLKNGTSMSRSVDHLNTGLVGLAV
jgi:hypothetical protein